MKKEIKTGLKRWEKPELIVMTRSKPEETVLVGCKTINSGVPDSGTNRSRHQKCARINCGQNCNALSNS
jgi:hypothetical protein